MKRKSHPQAVGRVEFICDTPQERNTILDRIDKLLDELPNNFHVFTKGKGIMKETAQQMQRAIKHSRHKEGQS